MTNNTMWTRHLLIGCVICVGLGTVGSQLKKQQLSARYDPNAIPSDCAKIASWVDEAFRQQWLRLGLVPAEAADNLLIARRLSLSLTGRIPSLEEMRALETLPQEHQIPWWLQRLFSDRRYSDYVAERLARAYVGTEEGPFIVFRRRRFVSWLSDALAENRPYDETVRALIRDRGAWTDAPGVNFITVTNGTNEEGQPDEVRLAARTTRAFLGMRLDCVQCHDDNLGGDWLQSDFHQLAAFFSQVRSSGLGIQDTQRDYEFTYLGADESEVVNPAVPFCKDLLLPADTRRQQLAEWITHPRNKAFARATVNRVWALLFGRPLVEPIDNIPLEGPYPAGLDILASDFADHGYDLRRLIAQIAMTHVFQQQSRAVHSITEEHERYWAVFPITRLRPEQMAGSIVQSGSLKTIDSTSHILLQFISSAQIGDFVKRYGDTGEDEFEDRGGTIPQRLVMLNGNLVKERTKDDLIANAATRIAQQVDDDETAVNSAFLVALTRRPTQKESVHFVQLLRAPSAGEDRAARMEDLFWCLLNSSEFSWNH